MATHNNYVIDLRTDKDLGSPEFVARFLTGWRSHPDPKLRPELFDVAEPVRRSFDTDGVPAAINLWLSNKMGLFFKRRRRPKLIAAVDWHEHKGQDLRPYPWAIIVWLDQTAGDERAVSLFKFLIGEFDPAFGLVSIESDYRDKHLLVFEDHGAIAEQMEGTDIGRTLPGIYWCTYFGRAAIARVGEGPLRCALTKTQTRFELINEGYLLFSYESSSMIGTTSGRDREEEILRQLDSTKFFNRHLMDIDELRINDDTAREIEKAIATRQKRRS